jgi:LPXTG-site transpeptidase (sortase) family protein
MVDSRSCAFRVGNRRFSADKESMRQVVFGIILAAGVALIGLIYGPLLFQESVQWQRSQAPVAKATEMPPIDRQFGIVIPKIAANSRVIDEVDAFDPEKYQEALVDGVAHAKGSALPGQPGNVFLFAHSSVNFFEAAKYNSVFYLLHWLKPGDEIMLYYQDKPYVYRVEKVEQIGAQELEYIFGYQPESKLVLMTCWPPGTDWKRLVVTAGLW